MTHRVAFCAALIFACALSANAFSLVPSLNAPQLRVCAPFRICARPWQARAGAAELPRSALPRIAPVNTTRSWEMHPAGNCVSASFGAEGRVLVVWMQHRADSGCGVSGFRAAFAGVRVLVQRIYREDAPGPGPWSPLGPILGFVGHDEPLRARLARARCAPPAQHPGAQHPAAAHYPPTRASDCVQQALGGL
jgi:hypothetical protein